jgi:NADH:ubiquinone oxidoreductase subunit D
MHSFLGKRGDSYDRFLIRVREMYESINIVFQVLSNLTVLDKNNSGIKKPENNPNDFFSFFDFLYKKKIDQINRKTKFNSMENLIKHFNKYSEGITGKKGFTYYAVEAPKGEFGVSLISDGTSKPYRCKIRTPAYHHMHIMPRMVQGHFMADLVTVLGSQDIVFGDVDR